MEEKIILDTSDEAAKYVTGLKGWVSSYGHFWGEDERMARYDGSTHKTCECGELMTKGYTMCSACRDIKDIERYHKKEFKEWNGTDMLYSESHQEWFSDYDGVRDFCDDKEVKSADLRLMIGEPVYAGDIYVDPENYFNSDNLPEDEDIPEEIYTAFDALNKALKEYKDVLSWRDGKYRTTVEIEPEEDGRTIEDIRTMCPQTVDEVKP